MTDTTAKGQKQIPSPPLVKGGSFLEGAKSLTLSTRACYDTRYDTMTTQRNDGEDNSEADSLEV